MDDEMYTKGWDDAVEAMETRLESLGLNLDSHTKPTDLYLDFKIELTEMRLTKITTT